jgi:hypothetical protein
VLANDVAELIHNDPELADKLKPGTHVVSMQSRHSYDSAGPRFRKFAGELEPSDDTRRPNAAVIAPEREIETRR